MNNLILIIGDKGSGKTWKMRELLSKYSSTENTTVLLNSEFKITPNSDFSDFAAVAVEEVSSLADLEYIVERAYTFPCDLIVCSQMTIKEIRADILTNCKDWTICSR